MIQEDTKKEPKKKRGRPVLSKNIYKPEYAEIAEHLCRMFGATHKQLAEYLKISDSQLTTWLDNNQVLSISIKKGRDDYDACEIEKSLRIRAIGYEYEEKTQKKIRLKTGEVTEEISVTKKRMAPDTTACIFWLVNRQPERWKHLSRTIIQGDVKNPINHIHSANKVEDFNIVTDPKRASEVKKILQEAGAFDAVKASETTTH